MKIEIEKVRLLVAKYMATEGCKCCEGRDHEEIEDQLCELLRFPRFDDDSGYNYYDVAEGKDEKIK